MLFLPVSADQVVACGIRLAGKQRNEFDRALTGVKRRDQRLDDARRAVVSAGVAPGFKFVRLIDVPLTKLRRFVLVEAEMNS